MNKSFYKLPSDLVLDIKTRLKTLSGQLNGIVKMLDEGKDPEQIDIQFKSVDKGLQKAHYLLLDEVCRKALAIGIVKAVDSCPGNCGNEEKIEYLKKVFSNSRYTTKHHSKQNQLYAFIGNAVFAELKELFFKLISVILQL